MNKFRKKKQIRLRTILSTAKTEYIQWITNPRIIIVFVMLIFIKTIAIEPLMARADKFGKPLNILEPFIAVSNSGQLLMLIPAVFLILMSDFPMISGNTLFFIKRTGRMNWMFGQILFAVMSIITYITTVMSVTILFSVGNSYWSSNWSEVIRLYDIKFPNERDSFVSDLIPSNLYNQLDILPTLLHTFLLLVFYLLVLCMILFIFKMLQLRGAGLFAGISVIAIGVVTTSSRTSPMWLFPMANTIIWVHYTKIFSEPIKPVWYSYLYFILLIGALITVAYMVLKKANFYSVEDV